MREINRHDRIVSGLLARRGEFSLLQLFRMEEYPSDLMGFYGQGYSVSRFLVEIGGRPRFLQFVREGQKSGWDQAALAHYGLANCRELDRAWRSWYSISYVEQPGSGGSSRATLVRAQSASEE
jgi:hypothetical protein